MGIEPKENQSGNMERSNAFDPLNAVRQVNRIPVSRKAQREAALDALFCTMLLEIDKTVEQVDSLLKKKTERSFWEVLNFDLLIPTDPSLDLVIEDYRKRELRLRRSDYGYESTALNPDVGLPKKYPPKIKSWRLPKKDEVDSIFVDPEAWVFSERTQKVADEAAHRKIHGITLAPSESSSTKYSYYNFWDCIDRAFSGHFGASADIYVADLPYSKLEYILRAGLVLEGLESEQENLLAIADLLNRDLLVLEADKKGVQLHPTDPLNQKIVNGEIKQVGNTEFSNEAIARVIAADQWPIEMLDDAFAELQRRDQYRADITEYDRMQLKDPNRGSWELWEPSASFEYPLITISEPLYARDPRLDILEGGVIGIDFGTKSTVVVCQNESSHIQPMRIGMGRYEKGASDLHFENPTVMEFIDLDSFEKAYRSGCGRPMTSWEDLTISHTAFNSWTENDNTEHYFAYFGELKQWAGDPTRQIRIRDKRGTEINLPPYLQIGEGDFDPIERYAYYIGLYINNMHTRSIYMEYLLSFPVTYSQAVRQRILESFRKGLSRALPEPILRDPVCMQRFSVEEGAGEPAAYAVCALQEYQIIPPENENVFYGIFDFGGGTTDFDFGIWRKATGPKERRYRNVIHHFGDGGDQYLGGENLLELLAFQVFKENRDKLREKEIPFSLPPQCERFAGSELLLSDSQEARTNTRQLMEKLRPLWERWPDYEKLYTPGALKIRLFRRNGKPEDSVELKFNSDELEKRLRTRIEQGVDKFFDALLSVFEKQTDTIGKISLGQKIHLFLAGNSSKSVILQEAFQNAMKAYDERIDQKYDALNEEQEEQESHFELHYPLGTPQANEELSMRGIRSSADDSVMRPTGKTGVAIGLLQCRSGSKIKVINEKPADEEIKFRYWIGDDEDGFFDALIHRDTPYQQWIEYYDAGVEHFEFYYTSNPSAERSRKIPIEETRKKRLTLPKDALCEDWSIFLRVIGPEEMEYTVAESQSAVDSGCFKFEPIRVVLNS